MFVVCSPRERGKEKASCTKAVRAFEVTSPGDISIYHHAPDQAGSQIYEYIGKTVPLGLKQKNFQESPVYVSAKIALERCGTPGKIGGNTLLR